MRFYQPKLQFSAARKPLMRSNSPPASIASKYGHAGHQQHHDPAHSRNTQLELITYQEIAFIPILLNRNARSARSQLGLARKLLASRENRRYRVEPAQGSQARVRQGFIQLRHPVFH